MKKILVICILVATVFTLTACGKPDTGETTSTTTLTVATPEATESTTVAPAATTTEASETTTATTQASTTAATTSATTAAPDPTIALTQERVIMSVTDTVTLSALVENSADNPVWKSSASDVLTVENGVIKPLKAGEATVTATIGNVSADCKVTVVQPTSLEPISGGNTVWNTGIYRDGKGIYLLAFAANPNHFANKAQMVLWISQEGSSPARSATFGFSYMLAEGSGNLIYFDKEGTRKNYNSAVTLSDYPEVEFTVSYENAGVILGAYFPYSYFDHVSAGSVVIKPEDIFYFAVQSYDGSVSYNTTYQDITVDFTAPNTYLQWNPDCSISKHEIETDELDPAAIMPPDFATVEYIPFVEALSAVNHSWDILLSRVSNGLVVKLRTDATDFSTAKEQIVIYLTTNNTVTNRAIVRSFSYYPATGSYDLINFNDNAKKTTLSKDVAIQSYPEVLCSTVNDATGTEVIWFIPYAYFEHLAKDFPISGSYGADMPLYIGGQGYDGKNSYNISYNGQDATFTNASTYIKWNPDNTLG